MSTKTIKMDLEKLTGVPEKLWKRHEKTTFKSEQEFASKYDGLSFSDLKHADWNKGTLPSSGDCRVFVAHQDGQDFCGYVLTGTVDEYFSVTTD